MPCVARARRSAWRRERVRRPAGPYMYVCLGEYVHSFKKRNIYSKKNVTVILAPRLKKWYVDHVDHMWTIFQPPPNIHVDRLVHIHGPHAQIATLAAAAAKEQFPI
jgi:hypothetical protein